MSAYLVNMANILRAAGLNVIEEQGKDKATGQLIPWQRFGRSGNSQYANGRPTHIMQHHTASNTTARNDVNYCNINSDIRPLTNLYAARNGDIHVCAGGPSNTNGKGHDYWGGGVADNDMNRHAIGIEIGNDGTGQPYPAEQQGAVLEATIALAKAYNIPANNVRAHFEWAPARKVDPRGPSHWTSGRNEKWNMNAFRNDVASASTPLPPPPTGDEDMAQWVWTHADTDKPGAYWVTAASVVHLDGPMRDHLISTGVPHHISHNDSVWESYRRVAQGLPD